MDADVADLIAVLEAEVGLGESLQRNLDAQREAILAWNMEALLRQVEARETHLRTLAELEHGRMELLKALPVGMAASDLSHLVAQLVSHPKEQKQLRLLQKRSRQIFTRLLAEERTLQALKENLVAHIHEAMGQVLQKGASVYGGSGQVNYGPPATLMYQKV